MPDTQKETLQVDKMLTLGALSKLFKDGSGLRGMWSNPLIRRVFLEDLTNFVFGKDELLALQNLINAESSDIVEVLEYVSYAIQAVSRKERVAQAKNDTFKKLSDSEKEFLEFVLSKYIETGFKELDQEKLPH
ncbi:type I restriction-modification enzyme R subunit C-terminal domain-containing protein [Planococcus liqunii]